jgi:serralysin
MCHLCGNPDHLSAWLETDNAGGGLSASSGGPLAFATGANTVNATGVTDVDGLLGGLQWNSTAIDFNFPGLASYYAPPYGLATGSDGVTTADLSTGFVAVSETFKTMTRTALAEFAAVTNLAFNEVGASATSNISIGRTTQLGSGTPLGFSGYGYYPGSSQRAGDIWFANSTSNVGDEFVLGRGTYSLVLHELGHAMGLKHGHQGGGVANVAMTAAHDFNDYSVMSYRRELGGATSGLTSEAFGRPQSLMMYDILALQTMYGADYGNNAGNTVYRFSTTTGQMFVDGVGGAVPGNGAANSNRVYRTVWDGDGVDTYDFSNYATNLSVDLTPGGRSTLDVSQLAVVNSGTGGRATGNLFNALQFGAAAPIRSPAMRPTTIYRAVAGPTPCMAA